MSRPDVSLMALALVAAGLVLILCLIVAVSW